MVCAFTTAAVVNHSMCPPKEAVAPLRYMPNAQPAPVRAQTEEELEAESAYNLKVLQLAAQMKAAAAKRQD